VQKIKPHLLAYASLFLLPCAMPALAGEGSFAVGAGLATAPAYQGAKQYLLLPAFQVAAGYKSDQWGSFSAGVDGLRWQLSPDSMFNLALLAGYDAGRKEDPHSFGRRDNSLQGMGKLSGSLTGGLELGLNLDAYRFYLKGMQGLKKRAYGGEDLGHTLTVELGINTDYALSDTLSLDYGVSTTWANSGYHRGYFGVTDQQAQSSKFAAYRPDSGMQKAEAKTSLTYAFTPNIALTAGVVVSSLLGDAAKSPITEKKVAVGGFTLLNYQF